MFTLTEIKMDIDGQSWQTWSIFLIRTVTRWLNAKKLLTVFYFTLAIIILFKTQLEHKLYIYLVNLKACRSSAVIDVFSRTVVRDLVDFDACIETTQDHIFAQSRLFCTINHSMTSAKTSPWTHSHLFPSWGKESFFKMIFNIFNFQRQIGSLDDCFLHNYLTGQLFCEAVDFILLSTWEKTPVYFCAFLKTSAVDDDYASPLSIVSKHLAATAQRLKLHKCGTYSPTTKGLHKGDMSRTWQWFDIEVAQRRVKLLWLC